MVALKIDDVKQFTSQLFLGSTFDDFLVKEAQIVTFNSFTIDGHIRQGYYSEQELEESQMEDLSSWQMLKPFCFSLIKGKRLPGSFQIIFQLSPRKTEVFLAQGRLDFVPSNINGLYLNIRYEEGSVHCVTGTSLNVFTLDKTLEQEWDQTVCGFLKDREIGFDEI